MSKNNEIEFKVFTRMSVMSFMPGLASATGTRFDSASKHNMACKIDGDLIRSWMSATDKEMELKRNKLKYAMQKDELVMNVATKLSPQNSITRSRPKAYPPVVTTLAEIKNEAKECLFHLYGKSTPFEFWQTYNFILATLTTPDGTTLEGTARQQLQDMPLLQAQGYALGTAYASSVSGDTVASVIIGGIVTVLNGAFTMRAGQQVQWYFTGEEDNFQTKASTVDFVEGERTSNGYVIKVRDESGEPPNKRAKFQSRMYGMQDYDWRKGSFAIKPYVVGENGECFGDKIRVFAKCITGGRAHDHVDIMLMTQSL